MPKMPKARPEAICSDELAKPVGSYVHESAYYAHKPGLGQGELKCLKFKKAVTTQVQSSTVGWVNL